MITTIGVFATHTNAEKVIQALRDINIDEKDLSYLFMEEGSLRDGQGGDKASSATVVGVTTGAVIGGIAGLVIANGIIPGFGSLVVAGPLAEALGLAGATALVGAGAGAVVGGLIGGLTHLGVPQDDVHLYEEHVRHGGVLIIARTETMTTKDIFKEYGGKDVQEYRLS
jgi:hypothetical protein